MTTTTSSAGKSEKSGSVAAGLLAASALFIVGYTLTRTVLFQPSVQSETSALSTVIPHEATLWNADL